MVLVIAPGCGAAGQDIDDLFRSIVPPSPGEAARDMLDPNDADRRRRGVVLIANSYFADEDAYVRTYRNYAQTDEDPLVRAAATEALGRHGDPEDAAILAAQLRHDHEQVRWAAARGLQRLHNPAVIGSLVRVLGDEEEEPDVRAAAAVALGQYRSHRAVEGLVAALETRHLSVNLMAQRSLRILTGQDFGMDRRAWIDWYDATDEPFAQGVAYLYPTYSRDETLLEKFAFWTNLEFEEPAPPRGSPYEAEFDPERGIVPPDQLD